MAIPKINEEDIAAAIKYIEEHGVPEKNKSSRYVLVTEEGKQYPPKYVIAVANHLANGVNIITDGFNAVEAKNYFETRGYNIESKQEKYELTITAKEVSSTDERFTMNNLSFGDNYRPIDTYFVNADGETIRRKYNKGERRNTNQTLPRLTFQIFESQINNLSDLDKASFPVCKYTPEAETICGIFKTVEEFLKYKNSMEHLTYRRENGPQYVIYAWNLFSTLLFVQECLRRFGREGDKFILVYRDKTEQERNQAVTEASVVAEEQKTAKGCKNPYSKILLESKNIIFRGAPGTGKSYLAKEIAADIISDGYTDKYTDLSDEQKKQVEFVQFHPSYDYSDFVEGLRPRMNKDGSIGFELQDGIFKKFVDRARKNFEDSQKSKEVVEQEISAKTAMTDFFGSIDLGEETFTTIKGNEFTIVNVDDRHIDISIPGNATIDKLSLNIEGEISKILGELFFSIDPGYRGKSGEVATQYSNMHTNPNEKFYIPENVYIIGTMNDIDRSVDSFDFAMRRRFRFVEVRAENTQDMLESLEDEELKTEAIARMDKLNAEIIRVPDLNENYQIGASYFLKLKVLGFDDLWTDYLQPLLQDYVRGLNDEGECMRRFAKAYGYTASGEGDSDEAAIN